MSLLVNHMGIPSKSGPLNKKSIWGGLPLKNIGSSYILYPMSFSFQNTGNIITKTCQKVSYRLKPKVNYHPSPLWKAELVLFHGLSWLLVSMVTTLPGSIENRNYCKKQK